MRPDTAQAFDRMAAAAHRDGVDLLVVSAFRSDAEQARLFAAHPDRKWVADGHVVRLELRGLLHRQRIDMRSNRGSGKSSSGPCRPLVPRHLQYDRGEQRVLVVVHVPRGEPAVLRALRDLALSQQAYA